MEGQDIRGLMEAYSQVYETPEVLNEEVVEEDVEQIDEIAINPAAAGASRNRSQAAAVRSNLQRGGSVNISGPQGFFGGRDKAGTAKLDTAATKSQGRTVLSFNQAQTPGGFRGSQKGAYTPNSTVVGGEKLYKAKLGGKDVYVGARKPGQTAPAPTKPGSNTPSPSPAPTRPGSNAPAPARPSAAPAKPTSTQKPTAPAAPAKPAPGTKAAGPESIKPKTPNPLMQRTFGYQTGNAPDQVAKASQGISKETSDKAFAKSKEMVKNIKPSADLKMDLDIFDLVKGHLLDEGYAETEENAIVMMANMSEEWRKSILETHGVQLDEVSYSAKEARAGEDIGKPGKMFGKIAKEAGERYGSKERGEKVAGAVLAKLRAKKG
jgi:hypothetical protein